MAIRPADPTLGKTVGNDVGLQLTASVSAVYDGNIYRTSRAQAEPVDDVIVTPTVLATYRLPLGLNEVRATALVGYDQFVEQAGRSKPRFDLSAEGRVYVVGSCHLKPLGSYRVERADYGDLNRVSENLQKFSILGADATCERPAGLFPEIGYRRTTTRNADDFVYADQTTDSFNGAVGLSVPSLGTARAGASYDNVDRPALGFSNHITRIGVTFDRSVSPRFTGHVDIHSLRLRSTNGTLRDYDGVGWDVIATSRLLLPLIVRIETKKSILNDSLTASGYAIESLNQTVATLPLSARTVLEAAIDYRRRHFRQVPTVSVTPILADKVLNFGATLTRSLNDRFRITAAANRSQRRTDPTFANYNDFRFTLGVSAIF